jgi:hypothetical protein
MSRATPLRIAFASSGAAISSVYYCALARAGPD